VTREPTPRIRPAVGEDVAAIIAIYSQGIEDRVGHLRDAAAPRCRARRLTGQPRPLLVAEAILGFARVSPYSERAASATVSEHAVHVARAARGRRLGHLFLDELVRAAEDAGLHKLTSRVFTTTPAAGRCTAPSAPMSSGYSDAMRDSTGEAEPIASRMEAPS
jgi:L-amino acid N-acyltransferase YncA